MRDLPINRIMTTDPESVGPDFPVSAARSLLGSGSLHHLPVVDEGKLVGIVSSADLLKIYLLENGLEPRETMTVDRIMTRDPVFLESRANLRDAASKLMRGGFHALPVVDADQTLVGIVTSTDLIDHLLHQIPSGDGSIQSGEAVDESADPDDSAIAEALREASRAVDRGDEQTQLAKVLLFLKKRNRILREACKAAELYVRSGHGEHEHAVLVKRLAELQGKSRRTDI